MAHGVCLQTLPLSLLSLTVTISLFAITDNAQALKVPSTTSCKKQSACSCYLDHKGIIDLSSLSNTVPAFKLHTNELFCEWNPCQDFTDVQSQGSCVNTKLCKQEKKNNTYLNLGSEVDFFYNTQVDEVVMIYQAGEMHTEISLKCTDQLDPSFDVMPPFNKTHLYLALFSRCACPGHCVKGLSAGSILCIIFFSVVISYFAVGALYRKTVYQSEGWDMVPQREFWLELPSLIRDGYMFFISPCLGNRVQYTMYQHVPGHNFEETLEDGEDDEEEEYEQR